MGTTTASKHGLRVAATERRNRHAQRTPLPPRPGVVQDARDAIAATDPDAETPQEAREQYGRMSVAELKARAAHLGVKPLPRAKDGLLNAILRAERSQHAETEESERVAGPEPDYAAEEVHGDTPAQGEGVEETLDGADDKSLKKALSFRDSVVGYGWAVSFTVDGNGVQAVARRDSEVINQRWLGGVWSYEDSTYCFADRVTRPRNAAQAKWYAGRPADKANEEFSKVVKRGAYGRPKQTRGDTKRGNVSFGLESTLVEVREAITGRRVKWVNRISNNVETATVSPNPRWLNLVQVGEDRVVQFCSDQGFRAFRLADVLAVK